MSNGFQPGFRNDLSTGWLSPIHFSQQNGVHADFTPFSGGYKEHVPFLGQTTLPMFGVGSRPSYENDRFVAQNNFGTLKGW